MITKLLYTASISSDLYFLVIIAILLLSLRISSYLFVYITNIYYP